MFEPDEMTKAALMRLTAESIRPAVDNDLAILHCSGFRPNDVWLEFTDEDESPAWYAWIMLAILVVPYVTIGLLLLFIWGK